MVYYYYLLLIIIVSLLLEKEIYFRYKCFVNYRKFTYLEMTMSILGEIFFSLIFFGYFLIILVLIVKYLLLS